MKTTNALFGILTITLALAAQVQAQFSYSVNDDSSITITGYTGANGPVVIPTTINGLPVTTINDYALSGLTGITSVTIGSNIVYLGGAALYDCPGLTNVVLPNSITEIQPFCFQADTSLGNITIPNSVTSIDYAAFWDCTGLTNVQIPNSVSNIGDFAFQQCTSLVTITIPASVTNVGGYAFNGCTSLTRIYFQGNSPSVGAGTPDSVFLGAPAVVYSYEGTTGWSTTLGGVPVISLPIYPPSTTTLIPNPTSGGMVYGGGVFPVGSEVQISATPDTGWIFIGWSDGSTNNPRTITVPTNNMTYVANFTNLATVTIIAAPSAGGTVYGGGVLAVGAEVQINATPNTNWTFISWSDGDTDNPRSITVPASNTTYVAEFRHNPSLTLIASPPSGGIVDGAGTYSNATQVQISAIPADGWQFSGWSDGSLLNPRTVTVLYGGLALAANFTFNGVGARYVGLFWDASNGIATESSGGFSAALTVKGSFTANLSLAGKGYSFSGQFSPSGTTSNRIVRPGHTPLIVQLQMDSQDASALNGEISTETWTAQITGKQTTFSVTNRATEAGKYTLAIPGETNAALAPGGDGFCALTVNTLGSVSGAGSLGDGTTFSPGGTITENACWPLYRSLYSGQGEIIGWLAFTNAPAPGIVGTVTWIKETQPNNKLYPSGFTNQEQVVGSGFGYTNGHPLLTYSNGDLVLTGGNLSEIITSAVTITTNGRVTGTNHASVTVNTSSGLFTGSIQNPMTKNTVTLSGAILENQGIAVGHFLGTNESGQVSVGEAP